MTDTPAPADRLHRATTARDAAATRILDLETALTRARRDYAVAALDERQARDAVLRTRQIRPGAPPPSRPSKMPPSVTFTTNRGPDGSWRGE